MSIDNQDVLVIEPEVLAHPDGETFAIRFQFVEETDEGRSEGRPSGKYISLSLTPADAMELLGHLRGAQARFRLPEYRRRCGQGQTRSLPRCATPTPRARVVGQFE